MSRFMPSLGKFSYLLKSGLCKRFDKYHVCRRPIEITSEEKYKTNVKIIRSIKDITFEKSPKNCSKLLKSSK